MTELPNDAITHICGAWWTGRSRAHCSADGCHRTFSCDSAAERHRRGSYEAGRRCVDPSTVGLVPIAKPWGVMWQFPAPEGGHDAVRGAGDTQGEGA